MSNGVVEHFKLIKFVKVIDKIIKLRKKYDNKDKVIEVNLNISVSFGFLNEIRILVNGNPVIAISGSVLGLGRALASGFTLGAIKSQLRLCTKDKAVANNAYLDNLYLKIEENLPNIEKILSDNSKRKWSV